MSSSAVQGHSFSTTNLTDPLISRDPHRLTYRIRNIPSSWSLDYFRTILIDLIGINDHSLLHIRSFSADVARYGREPGRVAVVSVGAQLNAYDGKHFLLETKKVRLEADTEFDGFTPLSPIEYEAHHEADCIIIPGWAGHPIGSFMSEESPHVWLIDNLAADFPRLRVWTYGYSPSLREQGSGEDILEFSHTFVLQLRLLRNALGASQKRRPVIYIAHSLGGLVFKEAIIRMSTSNNDDDRTNFIATFAAFFFGVPSAGMDVEALATMIGDLPARTTLHDLDARIGQKLRNKQHQQFCEAFQFSDSTIVRFYELLDTQTVQKDETARNGWSRTGSLKRLVDYHSATLGRSWEVDDEYIIGLRGNHSTIVKLPQYRNDSYDKIYGVLTTLLASANTIIQARFRTISGDLVIHSHEGPFQAAYVKALQMTPQASRANRKELDLDRERAKQRERQACLASLAYTDMGSRVQRVENSLKGTCEWIYDKPGYKSWLARAFSDKKHSVLWIKGKAGSGKSTLMKHLLKRAKVEKQNAIVVSFFFDARGSLLERTPLGLFRSFLGELFDQAPGLIDHFLPVYRKMIQRGEGEWRQQELKEWFQQLLKSLIVDALYVFVDALDECNPQSEDDESSARKLVHFFEDLILSDADVEPKSPLLLCLSSRHYPHITIQRDVLVNEIFMEGETQDDIRRFIRFRLGHSPAEDDCIEESLLEAIAERSEGVFLWVVLVVTALQIAQDRGRTQKEMTEILYTIPRALNDLYRQIMGNLEEVDRTEAATLLLFLLFAPLNNEVFSLRHALAFARESPPLSVQEWMKSKDYSSVASFRKRVRDLSCGLVEITNEHGHPGQISQGGSVSSRVQFIHETTRAFFSANDYQRLREISPLPLDTVSGRGHESIMETCLNYIASEEVLSSSQDLLKSGNCYTPQPTAPHCLPSLFEEPRRRSTRDETWQRVSNALPFLQYAVRNLTEHAVAADLHLLGEAQIKLMNRFQAPTLPVPRETSPFRFSRHREEQDRSLFKVWVILRRSLPNPLTGLEGGQSVSMRSSLLEFAAGAGLKYCIPMLLEQGSDGEQNHPNAKDALVKAIEMGHQDVAALLIEAGTNVGEFDKEGRTALFYTTDVGTAQVLITAGADVNARSKHGEPVLLHHINCSRREIVARNVSHSIGEGTEAEDAMLFHRQEMVRCLLRHGADVNAVGDPSYGGFTALHMASENFVGILLAYAPDTSIRDSYGRTAREHAEEHMDFEKVRTLEEYQRALPPGQSFV